MVSALASSSVRLPRSVSVKVLVSDWDLLCSTQKSSLVYYICSQRGKVKDQMQRKVIMLNVTCTLQMLPEPELTLFCLQLSAETEEIKVYQLTLCRHLGAA